MGESRADESEGTAEILLLEITEQWRTPQGRPVLEEWERAFSWRERDL